MTATERVYADLVANVAQTISLTTPFTRIEVVKVSDDTANVYVLTGTGVATVKGNETYPIVGGKGAFDDQIIAPSGSLSVSVIADANCTIYVGWKAR